MTKEELLAKLYNLKKELSKTSESLNLDQREKELRSLEQKTELPSFWQNRKEASEILEKIDYLKKYLTSFKNLGKETEELIALLAITSEDEKLFQEVKRKTQILIKKFDQLQLESFLKEKYDKFDTLLSIHSGAGGIEACDWAEMLMRMYLRYAEKKGYKVKILDQLRGEEAGIKNATLEISGAYIYGYLKGEAGVHRLVRISPFDADRARHTSFALVEVIPLIEEEKEIEIPPEELKMEVFRSSGPGGQHAQKTSSAVRITHLPTGLVASCQSSRSQYQNKITAFHILKSRLAYLKEKEEKEKLAQLRGEALSASWGNQIRSYILHPYQMVKDHRTGFKTSATKSVLDGNIDDFIEAYLRKKKQK